MRGPSCACRRHAQGHQSRHCLLRKLSGVMLCNAPRLGHAHHGQAVHSVSCLCILRVVVCHAGLPKIVLTLVSTEDPPGQPGAMLCRACRAGPQAGSALAAVHRTTIASSAAWASCSFCFRSGAPLLITPSPLCFPVPARALSAAGFVAAALGAAAAAATEAAFASSTHGSGADTCVHRM